MMASVAMEVHDSDNGGPDVDAGWWNPDGGGVILTAHLRNPRRGWGGDINSDRVECVGCGEAGPVGVI
jgi:hypothetical protein